MKQFSYLVLAIAFLGFTACNNNGTANFSGDSGLNNELDSVSYSLGVAIAQNLKRDGITEINTQSLSMGMMQVLNDDSLSISAQDGQTKIQAYFQKMHVQKLERNKAEGEKFLEENKTKDGVVVLESGLQYKVIKKGDGPVPTDSSTVKVHYTGTLIDGTQFDSSRDKGQPFETKVNGRIIKGWTEILQNMTVGSKYMVYIPTELAYGTHVRPGGPIEANMALIFEMELLEIVKPKKEELKNNK